MATPIFYPFGWIRKNSTSLTDTTPFGWLNADIVYEASGRLRSSGGVSKGPEPAVIAIYRFDEGTGTSTTADSSGNGYTATLVGSPTWSSGSTSIQFSNPYALTFNGSSQYVDISAAATAIGYPASNTSTYTFSISLWFKATTGGVIFGQYDTGSGGGHVPAIYLDNSGNIHETLFWHNLTTTQNTTSGTNYADGNWHHVAGVYNNGTDSLYVDGTFVTSLSSAVYSYYSSYKYTIGHGIIDGSWPSIPSAYFTGSIDDVRLYSSALTSTQVAILGSGVEPDTGIGTIVTVSGIVQPTGKLTTSGSVSCSITAKTSATGNLTFGGQCLSTVGGLIPTTVYPFGRISSDSTSSTDITPFSWISLPPSAYSYSSSGGVAFTGIASATNQANIAYNASGRLRNSGGVNKGFDPTAIAIYHFDEGTGTSTTADSTGNGYTATLVGSPTWSSGSTGIQFSNPYALTFNGSSQYVDISAAATAIGYTTSSSTSTYTFSISLWFKTTTNGVIFGQHNVVTGPNAHIPAIYIDTSGNIRESVFYYGTISTSVQNSTSGTNYADGNWHHVAGVYNNGIDSLYVDGVFVASFSWPETSYSSSYNYTIGYGPISLWPAISNQYFTGSIDDVRLYSSALTSTQVATLGSGSDLSPGVGTIVTVSGIVQPISGPTFTGLASTAQISSYVIAATGGISVSSAVTVKTSGLYFSTSGLTFTGTASYSTSSTILGAGNLTLTGLASQRVTGNYTSIGNVTVTGLASYIVNAIITPTGSLNLTGLALQKTSGIYATISGLSVSGLATQQTTGIYVSTGTLTLNGLAFTTLGNTYNATGSLTVSGIAPFTVNLITSFVGGVAITGLASQKTTGIYDTTGKLSLSGLGDATQVVAYLYSATGGFTLTGIASQYISVSYNATGNLTVTGLANINGNINTVSTGNLSISGLANVIGDVSASSVGGLVFTGLATYINSSTYIFTGGLSVTGLASQQINGIHTTTGNLTVTGLTSQQTSGKYNSVGNLVFGGLGTASQIVTYSILADGGLTLTGLASQKTSSIYDTTGSLFLSGLSSTSQAGSYVISTNGGLTLTGLTSQQTSGKYDSVGNLVFSGLATANQVVTYSTLASGGLTLTGLATYSNAGTYSSTGNLSFNGLAAVSQFLTYSALTSGSLTLTGLASQKTSGVYLSTGNLVFNGIATASQIVTYSILASGGLTITGLATEQLTGTYSSTGNLVFSGLAATSQVVTYSALTNGGLALTGLALQQVNGVYSFTGSLIFGGLATTKQLGSYTTSASGGITLTGVVLQQVNNVYDTTGSLSFSGLSLQQINSTYNTSGGLVFDGLATLNRSITGDGSGNLILSGNSSSTINLITSATGGISFSGTATANVAISGLVISGLSTLSGSVKIFAAGNTNISGSASASINFIISATGGLTTSGIVANFATAPSTLTVTPIGYRILRLNWTAATNSPIGYKIERSSDGITNWTIATDTFATVLDNGTLQPSTTYYYRVRAYNAYGDGSYSNIASNTTWFSNKNTYWSDDLNSSSNSSSYTSYAGTWTQSGGIVRQIGTANQDPKKYYYNGSQYDVGVQIIAKVRPDTASFADERLGISMNMNTSGEGINLVFRDSVGIFLLNDHIAWFASNGSFIWSVGTWYWFKLANYSNTYYGKVWADGTNEPNAWMISGTVSGAGIHSNGYAGFNGDSLGIMLGSFDDFSIQDISSSDINVSGTGNLGLSGTATVKGSYALQTTGQITLSGIVLYTSVNTYSPSGKLTFSGISNSSFTYSYYHNTVGSLIVSGVVSSYVTGKYNPSNGINFTGLASYVSGVATSSSGRVNLAGLSGLNVSVLLSTDGTLELSGSADMRLAGLFSMTGNPKRLSGEAEIGCVSVIPVCNGSFCVLCNGSNCGCNIVCLENQIQQDGFVATITVCELLNTNRLAYEEVQKRPADPWVNLRPLAETTIGPFGLAETIPEDNSIRDAMRAIFLAFQDKLPPRPRWYAVKNGRVVPTLGRDICSKMATVLSDHLLRAKVKKNDKIFDANLLAGYLRDEFQCDYRVEAEDLEDSIIVTIR